LPTNRGEQSANCTMKHSANGCRFELISHTTKLPENAFGSIAQIVSLFNHRASQLPRQMLDLIGGARRSGMSVNLKLHRGDTCRSCSRRSDVVANRKQTERCSSLDRSGSQPKALRKIEPICNAPPASVRAGLWRRKQPGGGGADHRVDVDTGRDVLIVFID
jgi:hypothetical protein